MNLNVFSNVPPFSHPDVKVAFDNFRVNAGTFSCPSWWNDSSADWKPLSRHGDHRDGDQNGDDGSDD